MNQKLVKEKVFFFTGFSSKGGAEQMMVALSHFFSAERSTWEGTLVVLLKDLNPSPELVGTSSRAVNLCANRALLAIPKIVKMLLREKPALLVSSLPHVSAAVALAKLISRASAVHLVRVESAFHQSAKGGFRSFFRERIVRRLLALGDHYIVVSSELTIPTAKWLGRGTESFSAIPNGLVLPRKRTQSSISSATEEGELKLISVGRLSEQKNFRLAIDVVALLVQMGLSRVSLDIFGEGPLRADLQSQIVAAKLETHVFLRGFVEDKSQMYQSGHLLLVTSLFEGHPLSIIEALAHGLPVVSVDCDFGPREILTSDSLGLLSSYGVEDLAAKILVTAERLTNRNEIDRRVKFVERNFSLASVVSKHEAVFLSKLGQSGNMK